jgi:glycosyltransferase involved in cell wall biosynthesis
MKNQIPISVYMPVYNSEKYIKEAIDSVLNQSFKEFEFIIVDDGSSDNSLDIIESYSDSRIKLIKNKHDYIGSLNLALENCQGKYVAKMDSDDIMHPDRLRVQYNIMEEDEEITVCSGQMELFGKGTKQITQTPFIGYVDKVLLHLIKTNFIYNATSMIDKKFLVHNNICIKNYIGAEDYKFFVDIAINGGIFYIESQSLHYYRMHETQISRRKNILQNENASKIRYEIIQYMHTISEYKNDYTKILDVTKDLKKGNLIDDETITGLIYIILLNENNLKKKQI